MNKRRTSKTEARHTESTVRSTNVVESNHDERDSPEVEQQFRLFVQAVKEYAMFQLDPHGHVVSWNSGAERLKGYQAEEIVGKHFSAFYLPEDIKGGKPTRLLERAAESGQAEAEGWRVRKDKSLFWANVVVTALRGEDGTLRGFAKITRDMTERHAKEQLLAKTKEELQLRVEQRTAVLRRVNYELRTEIAERHRVEEQLRATVDQLRALAARLQSVREEERASMAREIHDELGQACTAVKMDLVLIGRKTTKGQVQLRTKIESTVGLVDGMIATLRRIASELRPRTLDDLGLIAALEWQAHEFESRTRIDCELTLPQEHIVLDDERSTAVFRIFQESLTNVVRHANASRVEARLEKIGGHLVFQIQDNGSGFDSEELKGRKSLGITGMRERALLLNGELKIEGRPGQGTSLTLRIPLPSSASGKQAPE